MKRALLLGAVVAALGAVAVGLLVVGDDEDKEKEPGRSRRQHLHVRPHRLRRGLQSERIRWLRVLGVVAVAALGLSLGGCGDETFEEGAHYTWDVDDCESYYGGSAGGYDLIDRVGASGPIENLTGETLRFDMTVTYENDEADRSHDIAVVVAPGDKAIWSAELTYDPESEDSSDFWLDYYGPLNCSAVVDLVEATDEVPTRDRPLPEDEGPPDRSSTPAPGARPSPTGGFPMDTALRRDGCMVDEIGGVHATGSITNPFDEIVSLRIWADLVDSTGGVLDTANDIVFDLPPGDSYSYEILLESYGADGVSCSITDVEVQQGLG